MSKQNFNAVVIVNELSTATPDRVLLVPWGAVKSKSGDFVMDAAGAALLTAAFREHGTDLPIDYEHQTLGGEHASPSGQAPAAGWIKSVEIADGAGVFGRVEWTGRGKTAIASKEYRYLSPVVLVRKSDHRAVYLHSAGLTNKPAIAGMSPIVNSEAIASYHLFGKESIMDAARICAALGLGADATDDEVVAAIDKMKGDGQTAVAASERADKLLKLVAEETGVAVEGELELVANGLRTGFNQLKNPTDKVPVDQVKQLQEQLKRLQAKQLADECEKLLTAHSNKVTPAKLDWFRKWHGNDPAAAAAWIAEAPELVVNKQTTKTGEAATGTPDRVMIINSAKSAFAADQLNWGGRTVREYVHGTLLAGGHAGLTEEEAAKL